MANTHTARKWLQGARSRYAAPIAEGLRLLVILLELKIALYSLPRTANTLELAELKQLADWATFIDELRGYTREVHKANPTLAVQISPQLEFLDTGSVLRKRCLGDAYTNQWCHFFSWLSAYFIGAAEFHLSDGSFGSSICCSIRALDSCLTLWALNISEIDIDERYGLRMKSGKPIEGLYRLWEIVLEDISEQIPDNMKNIIKRINTAIFIRNKLALTHGVQHPSHEVATTCFETVRDFVYLIGRLTKDPQRVIHGLLALHGRASSAAESADFSAAVFSRISSNLHRSQNATESEAGS
ncbi:hypothetical protein [Burkholderia cenocepacia]|uniref:hypothetical protein n=1 Tax=Burkholderia cenocepacia TaxID=95486 RepID=UPI00223158C7|nr:hypothetical protein [Burkholderia cenocepacia]MCW3610739.1 hypothetical protein [Burkholderia cenocepacia]MCW5189292.1 hypothetical protein [Burkholderia cenocepacia]